MWLSYDTETGAIVVPPQDSEPDAVEGHAIVRVVGSALTDPPGTVWSPAARGFVDAPVLTTREFIMLWTPAEVLAVMNTNSPALAMHWAIALASPEIHLADSRVVAGVGFALADGIIDAARQDQILGNLPPGS